MASPHRDHVNDLLSGFGAGLGLGGCALDAAGTAQFAFDGVLLSLSLDEATGELRLLAPVGRPGAASLGPLLDSNLAADGMVVAREAGSGLVLLVRRLTLEGLELGRFEMALGAMVDRVEALRAAVSVATESKFPQAVERSPWSTGLIRG